MSVCVFVSVQTLTPDISGLCHASGGGCRVGCVEHRGGGLRLLPHKCNGGEDPHAGERPVHSPVCDRGPLCRPHPPHDLHFIQKTLRHTQDVVLRRVWRPFSFEIITFCTFTVTNHKGTWLLWLKYFYYLFTSCDPLELTIFTECRLKLNHEHIVLHLFFFIFAFNFWTLCLLSRHIELLCEIHLS